MALVSKHLHKINAKTEAERREGREVDEMEWDQKKTVQNEGRKQSKATAATTSRPPWAIHIHGFTSRKPISNGFRITLALFGHTTPQFILYSLKHFRSHIFCRLIACSAPFFASFCCAIVSFAGATTSFSSPNVFMCWFDWASSALDNFWLNKWTCYSCMATFFLASMSVCLCCWRLHICLKLFLNRALYVDVLAPSVVCRLFISSVSNVFYIYAYPHIAESSIDSSIDR